MKWGSEPRARFAELAGRAIAGWELDDRLGDQRETVAAHLDAAVAVPTMSALHARGGVDEHGVALPDGALGGAMSEVLTHLGWVEPGSGRWTRTGTVARSSSMHYGLVASYLPVLSRLSELYGGAGVVTSSLGGPGAEWHVKRELNVVASAAAHGGISPTRTRSIPRALRSRAGGRQPRFVADTGCGDGSWLEEIHLFDLIRERTLRGRRLEIEPLPWSGIDLHTRRARARPERGSRGPACRPC